MCNGCVANIFGKFTLGRGPTRRGLLAASAVTAATAVAGSPARAQSGQAETIFRGGAVLPAPGRLAPAQALAIARGKVMLAGSDADVMALRGPNTRIVDLAGRTLLPGFIDPHQHSLTGGLITAVFDDLGYKTYRTRAEVMAAMRAKAARTQPGQWLLWCNFDNLLQGGDFSMAELDTVSTQHPILVYYINMHDAAANSAAFRAANIPDDIGPLPGGGRFGRGPDGKLDGTIFEESALRKFAVAMPPITPAFVAQAALNWFRTNAAAGNTTVHEAGVIGDAAMLQGYARIASEAMCRASTSLMFEAMALGDAYKQYGYGAQATQIPNSPLTIYGIKIVGDGSNQTKSADQTQPYLGGTSKGYPNFNAADMHRMVAEVKANGWPVLVHCNGDATIDLALDAIEAAYGANPATGVNRIEHCTITRPDQIERMKRLGVQPSFLMNHIYFYGAAYRDTLFGPERAARADSAGDFVRAGMPFTLHTDAPCSNIGGLQLIQTAVTRKCSVDGSIVGPEQAISLDDALKAVTIHAAGQIGQAHRLGTLERGKEADLTILERNPYSVDPNTIMDIKVSQTWVSGVAKFGA
ncbi:amidohydrolase [Roseococcus sp. SDR]|uniref:amidohydrolase n=1 Tax=Roseococcus sp. SDR TaxID=2835532 RepID=UPI001BCBCE5D|nr:amidohydrolase [Roseococcus sp. SDR]MBS7790148.1 amidohydrolase [Roseococcus sp. SDR]MBV1845462.1 amidohydrolase [Roseococcus sp. SDR]